MRLVQIGEEVHLVLEHLELEEGSLRAGNRHMCAHVACKLAHHRHSAGDGVAKKLGAQKQDQKENLRVQGREREDVRVVDVRDNNEEDVSDEMKRQPRTHFIA